MTFKCRTKKLSLLLLNQFAAQDKKRRSFWKLDQEKDVSHDQHVATTSKASQ
jgi:hypothetical protein